jgi:membrane fusion protein (multidrug efflux system)
MKKYPLLILIQLVLFISACSDAEQNASAKSNRALAVDAYKVHEEAFSKTLSTTANLLAEEHVELVAPLSGKVLAIYFKEGQTVQKGEKLLRLDDRTWQAQLLGANAELDAATKDYARKKELLSVQGSSQEDVDNAFSRIQLLKAKVEELRVNISLANISAPFSGQLGMRDFSEGAFLKQGDFITRISANNKLKVDFTIPQIHLESIQIGKNITVLVAGKSLKAKVYALSPLFLWLGLPCSHNLVQIILLLWMKHSVG